MQHLFGTEPVIFLVSSEDKQKIDALKANVYVNFDRKFHEFIEKMYEEYQTLFWGRNAGGDD